MSEKHLVFSDKLSGIKDDMNFSAHSSHDIKLRGELTMENEYGEVLLRKSNTIVVGGRRFVLEKIFNLDPASHPRITLNSILGVNTSEAPITGIGPRRNQSILLFGVGSGGSDIAFGSVYAPDSANNNLFKLIPLRHVDVTNDLSVEEMKDYRMKVRTADKYSYYLKKFTSEPKLVMKQNNNNFVPKLTDNDIFNPDHSAIIREAVDIYCEIQFKISEKDVREWYIAQESIKQARINEIGLYYGYYDDANPNVWNDIKSCQLFSKITFDSEPLSNYTKVIYCTYRIYA